MNNYQAIKINIKSRIEGDGWLKSLQLTYVIKSIVAVQPLCFLRVLLYVVFNMLSKLNRYA